MQLDSALFEHVAAALGGAVQPADARDRVDVDSRVTVIPLTDSPGAAPFEITLRHFSPGGFGFLHRTRLGIDEQFVVLLPQSVAVLCQVAYYQPVADHSYAVGARFLRVLRRPAGDSAAPLPLAQPAP